MDAKREFLQHALATLQYRGGKTLRDAPESFAEYDGGGKTPRQILAHMGDLLEWSLRMAQGDRDWKPSAPLSWAEESARFYASLEAFDAYLGSEAVVEAPLERLFQGPVADALTHVGQLAMLRRMSGSAMKGENYFIARIGVE